MNKSRHYRPSLDSKAYSDMYYASINDPASFWADMATRHISWSRKWDEVISGTPFEGNVTWFKGAKLNVSYNCIDRHIKNGLGERVAFFWEGNDGESLSFTYSELLTEVCIFANVLKKQGVKRGDRVCIYMPMIPEAVFAMLACTRIGAVHSVVFGGFSAAALRSRIQDADCKAIITTDIGKRGDKLFSLKERVDSILPECPSVQSSIVVRTGEEAVVYGAQDIDYWEVKNQVDIYCDPEEMDAEDPLFILYTSGSTGKPKGVLHTTGGYMLYASVTHKYSFDYCDGDVYWCTADIGWVTGHTYIVYGPLANAAISVIYEGVPTYPDPSRYWRVVDKYEVNIFYSTPTAIRLLMGQGDSFVTQTSRKSLRILGTVGEPINPRAWLWYHKIVGRGECHIVDTWWQTETGGHAITPIPGVVDPKPGAAMLPFFGIEPVIVDEAGNEMEGEAEGVLLLKGSWPGQMRDLFNDHNRYLETYFRPYPGYYLPGDGARRDADGHLWITGRIDDTLNIAGRLIGTAEVESALVSHPMISEAAVIGVPHDIKGWAIQAYVCPIEGEVIQEKHEKELRDLVSKGVGSFAKPDTIIVVPGLPKTRSGKIMRRVLRNIAIHRFDDIGDTSTLANPEIIEQLIK